MKARESGMPDAAYWGSFFDADCVIRMLGCARRGSERIVEFGSGYGTFTLPAARRTRGVVHALDIEPELVADVAARSESEGLRNVRAVQRDFVEQGSGLPDASADHAMAYNILHLEDPVALLREAGRVLVPGGTLSIMHWHVDPSTPRGPPLAIRPRPEQCRAWAEQAGLAFVRGVDLAACCPYHWGMVVARPG